MKITCSIFSAGLEWYESWYTFQPESSLFSKRRNDRLRWSKRDRSDFRTKWGSRANTRVIMSSGENECMTDFNTIVLQPSSLACMKVTLEVCAQEVNSNTCMSNVVVSLEISNDMFPYISNASHASWLLSRKAVSAPICCFRSKLGKKKTQNYFSTDLEPFTDISALTR